jgi:DNA-directed RNA polymerase subunit RPC12/RpoP
MFLGESKEVNQYEKKSKYGKLTSYQRTKTLTHWKCDNCGKEFSKVRNGKYNPKAKSYCKDCISKIGLNKLASLAGYESKVKNIFEPKVGSVIIDKEGYPQVYIGKNYPYRNGGYAHIREHQYIMEMHLGRRLMKGEIVHHIDGNKRNNNIDNLYLTTVDEHNKLHAESESILFELYKRGVIIFDRTVGRYFLKE